MALPPSTQPGTAPAPPAPAAGIIENDGWFPDILLTDIRDAKHLKVKATGDQIEVGFFGWVARVARVHQFGEKERISKGGGFYKYSARPLLGTNENDRTLIRESILKNI